MCLYSPLLNYCSFERRSPALPNAAQQAAHCNQCEEIKEMQPPHTLPTSQQQLFPGTEETTWLFAAGAHFTGKRA